MIEKININESFCNLYIDVLLQKYPKIKILLDNLEKGFVQTNGHFFLLHEVSDVLENLNYAYDKVEYETQINSIESIDFIDDDDISNHFIFGIVVAMKMIQVWKRQDFKQKLIVYIVATEEKWNLIRCHEYVSESENYYKIEFDYGILQIVV